MNAVDVLAVMQKAADALPMEKFQLSQSVVEARAAVAELMEVISELSNFLNKVDWDDLSADTANETSRMWDCIDAALARCRGEGA